jgi:SAM-dependent methyltransferase
MNDSLEQWGHTKNVDKFQKYLWYIMYNEWKSFIGEISPPSLDIGAGKSKEHSTVSLDPFPRGFVDIRAIGENLPFQKGSFNSIIIESVLKHVLHPIKVLKEARRVIKDGGFLYLSSPVNRVDYHRHSFTGTQLFTLLEKSGFSIIRTRGIGVKYRRIDGPLWRRIPRIYTKISPPSRFSSVLFIIVQAT